MSWLRNPWWDLGVIFSGLPLGAVLLVMPRQGMVAFFTIAVVLETAHNFSPIALAWSHDGFRKIVVARPWKFICLPAALLLASLAIGCFTNSGQAHRAIHEHELNAFAGLVLVYVAWETYHFGMQNFGIAQLYRRARSWRRYLMMGAFLAATAFCFRIAPRLAPQLWLICMGAVTANHWIVSIGLCSAASRRGWLFLISVLMLGVVGFIWMIPTSGGIIIRVVPLILCGRMGLGFVHYLYDRWVWQLSDPQVRATIGAFLTARS
jgi:hypothetical protein